MKFISNHKFKILLQLKMDFDQENIIILDFSIQYLYIYLYASCTGLCSQNMKWFRGRGIVSAILEI